MMIGKGFANLTQILQAEMHARRIQMSHKFSSLKLGDGLGRASMKYYTHLGGSAVSPPMLFFTGSPA